MNDESVNLKINNAVSFVLLKQIEKKLYNIIQIQSKEEKKNDVNIAIELQ